MNTQQEILKILLFAKGSVSGEIICQKLGISRSAVWKHIGALREGGFEIESGTNKGYFLKSCPDRSVLERALGYGGSFKRLSAVDSTNIYAKDWAKQGAPHGSCVIADEQTAGRGRRGRNWSSPPGESLYMSVILRPEMPPAYAPRLTILAALAMQKAVKKDGVSALIKWPNDLLSGGKKLCGILLEMSAQLDSIEYVVLGLGVNVNQTAFEGELADIATSMAIQSGERHDPSKLAANCLGFLYELLEKLQKEGFDSILEEYAAASCTLGREVSVTGAQTLQGRAVGFDELGMLMVQTGEGVVKVASGDVSVRPVRDV